MNIRDYLPPWSIAGIIAKDAAIADAVPPVDPMDVTWPDGAFKVFPDRVEYTVNVDMVAPDTRDMWARIQTEVAERRLEASILEELSQVITERGTDAPGILIIKTPDGQWAIKESAGLAPGSAVLSTLDQPDLMAVAQGEGWLYYRQGPSWGESKVLADKGEPRPNDWTPVPLDVGMDAPGNGGEFWVDIMPIVPDLAAVYPCPDCGGDTFNHRAGCINE